MNEYRFIFVKKKHFKWCNWTMTFMIQPYIVTCNFSFKFDFDMPCVLFILNILKCMYRGLWIDLDLTPPNFSKVAVTKK